MTHEANLARLDDMGRRAAGRSSRVVASTAIRGRTRTEDGPAATVAIRRATAADGSALERLAALDSAAAPSGEVLIAEVGGQPHAAIEIATGATIADPFRPTAHTVGLLTLRARRLRKRADSPRRLRLRPRSAFRTA
jgi:hypothetical protein